MDSYYESALNKAAHQINNKGKWNARCRLDVVKLAHDLTPGSQETTCAGLFKALKERQKVFENKPLQAAMRLITVLVVHVMKKEGYGEGESFSDYELGLAQKLCVIVQAAQRTTLKDRAFELIQDVTSLKQVANRGRYLEAPDFLAKKISVELEEIWDSCIASIPSLVARNIQNIEGINITPSRVHKLLKIHECQGEECLSFEDLPTLQYIQYSANNINNEGKWNARSRLDVVKLAHELTPGAQETTYNEIFKALDKRQSDYKNNSPLNAVMEFIKVLAAYVVSIERKDLESEIIAINKSDLEIAMALCATVHAVENGTDLKGRAPELILDVEDLKQMADKCRHKSGTKSLVSAIQVQPKEMYDSCITSLPNLVAKNINGLGITSSSVHKILKIEECQAKECLSSEVSLPSMVVLSENPAKPLSLFIDLRQPGVHFEDLQQMAIDAEGPLEKAMVRGQPASWLLKFKLSPAAEALLDIVQPKIELEVARLFHPKEVSVTTRSELNLERNNLLWAPPGYVQVVILLSSETLPIQLATLSQTNTLNMTEHNMLRCQAVAIYNTGIVYENGGLRLLHLLFYVKP